MNTAASAFFEVAVIGDVTIISYRAEKVPPNDAPQLDVGLFLDWIEGVERLTVRKPVTWELFRNDLLTYLDTQRPGKVVLDFAKQEKIHSQAVISSAMNGVYALAKRRSAAFGCQWRLCGLTATARDLYEKTSLSLILPQVHDSREEAIAAFHTDVTID